MKVNEWIENKKIELLNSKSYKSVEFANISNCKVSKNMTSEIFDFTGNKINMNTEVKDFERGTLTSEIKTFKIRFSVIKPRCRKPESLYLYVAIVE